MTILILFASLACRVDDAPSAAPASLPQAWHGVWKGKCTTTGAGGKAIEFPMQLEIAPRQDGKATWTIIYGEGDRRQVRPYEIVPGDGPPGSFLIDEKNGVLLNCRLFGDLLVGQFDVAGNSIATRYELTSEGIRVELITFDRSAKQGAEGVDRRPGGQPEVQSWPVKAIQRGLLERSSTPAASTR